MHALIRAIGALVLHAVIQSQCRRWPGNCVRACVRVCIYSCLCKGLTRCVYMLLNKDN